MSDQAMVISMVAIPLVGFIIILYSSPLFRSFDKWVRPIPKSFLYALFLGIGIIGGSNSDPGFALPAPELPAAIFDYDNILFNAIIPFIFWWIFFLLIFYCIEIVKKFRKDG